MFCPKQDCGLEQDTIDQLPSLRSTSQVYPSLSLLNLPPDESHFDFRSVSLTLISVRAASAKLVLGIVAIKAMVRMEVLTAVFVRDRNVILCSFGLVPVIGWVVVIKQH